MCSWACECSPEEGSKYCREAEKSHVMEIGCGCEHSSNASSEGGWTLSLNGRNLRVEGGTTFNLARHRIVCRRADCNLVRNTKGQEELEGSERPWRSLSASGSGRVDNRERALLA